MTGSVFIRRRCSRRASPLPDHGCVEDASALLKDVADPTRLRLLSALNTGELCVCDLATVVGIRESMVSHQLRLLRAHRPVTFRQDCRIAHHRLLDHHVASLFMGAPEHDRKEGVRTARFSGNREGQKTLPAGRVRLKRLPAFSF